MKCIIALIFALSTFSVHAQLYKCKVNAKTSYQEAPCKSGRAEFELKEDISEKQHKAAVIKLEKELSVNTEKKQIAKELADKERLIRAQEQQAEANHENAIQSEWQTDAIDELKNKRYYRAPSVNHPGYINIPQQNQMRPPQNNVNKLQGKNVIKSPDGKPIVKKNITYQTDRI